MRDFDFGGSRVSNFSKGCLRCQFSSEGVDLILLGLDHIVENLESGTNDLLDISPIVGSRAQVVDRQTNKVHPDKGLL
jgi:hypothetical protein